MNFGVPLSDFDLNISLERRNAVRSVLIPDSPLLDVVRSESKFSRRDYLVEKQRALALLSRFKGEEFWKTDAGYGFSGKHLRRLVKPGCRIMDVGCSVGPLAVYLKHLDLWDKVSYLGIDLDRCDIEVAREEHPEGRFLVCDIQEPLPVCKQDFDIVYSRATIISTYFPYRSLDGMADVTSNYLMLVHTPLTSEATNDEGFISMMCANRDRAYISTVMEERLFMRRILEKGLKVLEMSVCQKSNYVANFGNYRLHDFLLLRD